MSSRQPTAWAAEHRYDRGLVGMTLISALVHAAAFFWLVVFGGYTRDELPPEMPYISATFADSADPGAPLPPAAAEEPEPDPEPSEPLPEEPEPEEPPPPQPEPEDAVSIPEPTAKPAPTARPKPTLAPTPKPKPTAKPKPKPTARPKPTRKPRPTAKPTLSAAEVEAAAQNKQIADAMARVEERLARAGGASSEGPVGEGESGVGSRDPVGLDFVVYKRQVEGTIKANWAWVGSDPNLRVRVGFGIDTDGRIHDIRVLRPSGSPSYDNSVLRAVRASSPLFPPPERYRDTFAKYELVFLSGVLAEGR